MYKDSDIRWYKGLVICRDKYNDILGIKLIIPLFVNIKPEDLNP